MMGVVSQPLYFMLGVVSEPLYFMLKIIHQPLWVMLKLLKRLPVQNTSPSFLVGFVRDITLLINSLLSWRCEEFVFVVILFLNILKIFNNQPLLVRLDPVTRPLVFMLGSNSHHLQVMLRENSHPLLVMLTPLRKLVVQSVNLSQGDHLTH